MNQVVTSQQQAPAKRERIEVIDAVPLLDTSRFEHMQRVATVMARSTLMPESLYMEGTKDNKTTLPYEQILSNCFLVVNQAVRWGLDPFAVAQCVSVVHGKLCYEGKLVAAVLQAKLGMSLHHHIAGAGEETRIYLSDRPFNEEAVVDGKSGPLSSFLKPGIRAPGFRLFDGSVAEWKTSGAGTPWTPKNFPRMLIYRGTRDWCRIYEPATMLGVYTDDEMVDMTETNRFRSARNITPVFDPLSDEPIAAQIATGAIEQTGAPDTPETPHDPLTGEILPDTNTDDPAPSPDTSAVDAATPSSASAEPEDASPSSSGSNLFPTDRADLIDCAKEMLSLAGLKYADDKERDEAFSQSKAEWERKLTDLHGQIGSIFVSAKAVANGKRTTAQARSFLAEVLGCTVEELEGLS